MLYISFISLVLIGIFIAINYHQKKKKQNKLIEILDKWGKVSIKETNMAQISRYHHSFGHQNEFLSDEIASDIDLDGIFAYTDRTNSKIGQQYLYHKLRHTADHLAHLQELDHLAETIKLDDNLRVEMEYELSKLNHRNAYYIYELFTTSYKEVYNKWQTFYIKIAGLIWVISCALTLSIVNQYLFLFTLGLTLVNFYIHYSNKGKIIGYMHSMPQIYNLMLVAKKCAKLSKKPEDIYHAISSLTPLRRTLRFINFQESSGDFISEAAEWLKALLLIEPAMFLRSIHKITLEKENIKTLFCHIGKIDMAISIQSLRISLPYYAKPDFTQGDEIKIMDLYHPLIANCVPNSIVTTAHQGTLITGSNMSGKTTFIRSVMINAVLSQTLYTSCTSSYEAPPLTLFTSIQISDNLEEDQSYFQSEAISILNILNKSNRQQNNLIVIDEIFRGTNTIERIAAANAILSYLTAKKNFVFVSTHDLELAELLGDEYCCYSFEEKAADTRLIFDYKIKPGILKNKNGIAILEALGYPQTVVANANEISTILRAKYNL